LQISPLQLYLRKGDLSDQEFSDPVAWLQFLFELGLAAIEECQITLMVAHRANQDQLLSTRFRRRLVPGALRRTPRVEYVPVNDGLERLERLWWPGLSAHDHYGYANQQRPGDPAAPER
jgi:hypothetical protein